MNHKCIGPGCRQCAADGVLHVQPIVVCDPVYLGVSVGPSFVVILDEPTATTRIPDPRDATIATLRAEAAELRARLNGALLCFADERVKTDALRADLATEREHVRVLRKALAPFAAIHASLILSLERSRGVVSLGCVRGVEQTICAADLRRAREALGDAALAATQDTGARS